MMSPVFELALSAASLVAAALLFAGIAVAVLDALEDLFLRAAITRALFNTWIDRHRDVINPYVLEGAVGGKPWEFKMRINKQVDALFPLRLQTFVGALSARVQEQAAADQRGLLAVTFAAFGARLLGKTSTTEHSFAVGKAEAVDMMQLTEVALDDLQVFLEMRWLALRYMMSVLIILALLVVLQSSSSEQDQSVALADLRLAAFTLCLSVLLTPYVRGALGRLLPRAL